LGDFDAHYIPGRGGIDFDVLYDTLEEIGYNGYVSAELGGMYIMDPTTACEETLDFFKKHFPLSHEK
jgi:sugar phosphate isomerase/epimerase